LADERVKAHLDYTPNVITTINFFASLTVPECSYRATATVRSMETVSPAAIKRHLCDRDERRWSSGSSAWTSFARPRL